jgi:hypothetical protein
MRLSGAPGWSFGLSKLRADLHPHGGNEYDLRAMVPIGTMVAKDS